MSRGGDGGGDRGAMSPINDIDEDIPPELLQYIRNLEETNNRLEDERERLEQELYEARSGTRRSSQVVRRGSGDDDETVREAHARVNQVSDELASEKVKTREAQAQIGLLEARIRREQEEKQALNDDKAALRKQLEETKQLVVQERLRAEKANRAGHEATQSRRTDTVELVRLLEENKQLREENEGHLADLLRVEEENQDMQELLQHMEEELREKEVEREDALTQLNQANRVNAALRKQVEDLQGKLVVMTEAEHQFEMRTQKARQDAAAEEARLKGSLEEARREVERLKAQIAGLREATSAGEREKETEVLKQLLMAEREENQRLSEEVQRTAADLMTLSMHVDELNTSTDDKANAMVANEKRKTKAAEDAAEALKARAKEDERRYKELEVEKTRLERVIVELEDWKAEYEREYGLEQAVLYQKQLNEDIRRRDAQIEEMGVRISEMLEDREFLVETCSRLKADAGKPEDFWYPDMEFRDSALGEKGRLQGLVKELERQVDSLEQERAKLLRTLRDNAAAISEKGFRYAGLTPQQLVQVNEFAKNLRDGKVELPLDDKSRELTEQVKQLKEQAKEDKHKMQMAQDAASRAEQDAAQARAQIVLQQQQLQQQQQQHSKGEDSEALQGLRGDMRALLDENRQLRSKIDELKVELEDALGDGRGDVVDSSPSRTQRRKSGHDEATAQAAAQVRELEQKNADLRARLRATEMLAQNMSDQADHEVATQMDEVARIMANVASTQQQLQDQLKDRARQQSSQLTALASNKFGAGGFTEPTSPKTEHGRELLSKLLVQLNLPPEEWADDVRSLAAQLVEALEELATRDRELEEHEELLRRYEGHLSLMRQQVSALYREHLEHTAKAHDAQTRMKADSDELREQRTSLEIKVKKLEELVALEDVCEVHPNGLHRAAKDMTRRLMAFEVNEARLTRKYTAMEDQLKAESAAVARLENDLVEAGGTAKRRIAWLEEWKVGAAARIEALETQLDQAVPKREFDLAAKELAMLREDYVDLLQREADSRIKILQHKGEPETLRRMADRVLDLEVQLAAAQSTNAATARQLEHEINLTAEAVKGAGAAARADEDVPALVSEVAKFRGETARLEVELAAAKKRAALLAQRLHASDAKVAELGQKVRSLEVKEREAARSLQETRAQVLDMQTRYGDGGLTAEEAEAMQEGRKALLEERAQLLRETQRYKELADVASAQVQSLATLRRERESDVQELRRHCAELESRSDDDAIIGKLQRTLMSTKASYRAFARKHEIARTNLRRKEAMIKALEMRLDDREDALNKLHDKSRTQVAILRRTLQNLASVGIGVGTVEEHSSQSVSIFDRAKALSDRVLELAKLAEQREADMKPQDAELRKLRDTIEELRITKSALMEEVQDLKLIKHGSGQPEQLERELGRRLLIMSDELKGAKVTLLQTRRQLALLRDEKRHLEATVAKQQDMLAQLEEERVVKEAIKYLPAAAATAAAAGVAGPDLIDLIFGPSDALATPTDLPYSDQAGDHPRGMEAIGDADNLLRDLEAAQEEVVGLMTQLTDLKGEKLHIASRLDAVVAALREHRDAVKFYEKQAHQERLETMPIRSTELVEEFLGNPQVKSPRTNGTAAGPAGQSAFAAEQQMLQEAANTTIASLKKLIEEKNRIIARYERKLAETRTLNRKEGAINKAEIDRLTEKLFRKNEDAISKLKQAVTSLSRAELSENGAHLTQRLMEQLEEATSIIGERDDTVRQLELRLRTAQNQLARAEDRCGAALEEQERMRRDMMTLATQLQDAEQRVLEALKTKAAEIVGDPQGGQKHASGDVAQLRQALASKEDKLKELRTAIVKLKEEFIKAEEEHARARETRVEDREKKDGQMRAETEEQVKALKRQVETLQAGLTQAKGDLEAARKVKAKAAKGKAAIEEENERITHRIREVEEHASQLEEDLRRAKSDLNEARRHEQRAKDKLKEVTGASGSGGEGKEAGEGGRLEQLERKVKLLTAQNVALRSAVDALPAGGGTRLRAEDAAGGAADAESVTGSSKDIKKTAWDADKRLKRRVEVLEKRLKERGHELEAAKGQAAQAKSLLERTMKEKESLQKRLTATAKDTTHAKENAVGDARRADADKARIFELEDQIARLRRKAELEQAQRIVTLTQQIETAEERISELESEVEAATKERREMASGRRAQVGLKEQEDWYLKEETLRDEVAELKRKWREAETRVLERESEAIELRFDVEESRQETERYKRRLAEVDAAYRTLSSAKAAAAAVEEGEAAEGDRRAGGRFRRERDLEGVVEAMKRVVEKLRSENERLRRGQQTDGSRTAEVDKRNKELKTKVGELQEQVTTLRGKVAAGEEAASKLAQKQDMIVQLRKQLRAKDETVRTWQQRVEALEAERDALQKDLDRANLKIIALDKEIIGLRALRGGRSMHAGPRDEEAQHEIERLRHEVAEQREVIDALRASTTAPAGGSRERRALEAEISRLKEELKSIRRQAGSSSSSAALVEEVRQLREENLKLQQELKAFDLDFFEEIEDLKFKYQETRTKNEDLTYKLREADNQLKMYKGRTGR